MAKTAWGRKETIIWPYYRPLYTYSTIAMCLFLTGLFLYCRFNFSDAPLQRFYAPLYVRTAVLGSVMPRHRSTYRMTFVGGGGQAPRPAMPDDVAEGRTSELDGRTIPFELSPSARQHGYTLLFRGPVRSYVDSGLSAYLRAIVFGGKSIASLYKPSILGGAIVFLIPTGVPPALPGRQ